MGCGCKSFDGYIGTLPTGHLSNHAAGGSVPLKRWGNSPHRDCGLIGPQGTKCLKHADHSGYHYGIDATGTTKYWDISREGKIIDLGLPKETGEQMAATTAVMAQALERQSKVLAEAQEERNKQPTPPVTRRDHKKAKEAGELEHKRKEANNSLAISDSASRISWANSNKSSPLSADCLGLGLTSFCCATNSCKPIGAYPLNDSTTEVMFECLGCGRRLKFHFKTT